MTPLKIKEAIVVEGKYDTIRLHTAVDTTVVETGGFSLFRDRERLQLLRELARTCGLIVLTDSDAAGFVIRDHIAGALPKEGVKHAYIPQIAGKERRKASPSAEGLLGVEGMDTAQLQHALLRAGATVIGQDAPAPVPPYLDKARLYRDGLSGAPQSAARRERMLKACGFPTTLSANRLIAVFNAAIPEDDYERLLTETEETP